jgi:ribonuclease P protein component
MNGNKLSFAFPKAERLCAVSAVEHLYKEGNTFLRHPLKINFLRDTAPKEGDFLLPKVLFVVPKRSFKKSVDRNLIKRRMREAYRLNKHLFFEATASDTAICPLMYVSFFYVAKEILTYQAIEKKIVAAITILAEGTEAQYLKPKSK